MKIGDLKKIIAPLENTDEVYISVIFTQNKEVLSRNIIQGEPDKFGNLNLKAVIRDVNKNVIDNPLKGPG